MLVARIEVECMGLVRRFLVGLFDSAYKMNEANSLDCATLSPNGRFLDLGCDEGTWPMKIANQAQAREAYGIEIIDERIEKPKE